MRIQNVAHPTRRVCFAHFELDLDAAELSRTVEGEDGLERVHLPPQAARLLVLLACQPGRLVERETLRAELWGERFVDWEAGLHQSVRRVRRALGDNRTPRRFVETVARRGYRFVAPVSTPAVEPPPERPPLSGPRLAVAASLALVGALWLFGSLALSERESAPDGDPVPIAARRLYSEGVHLASRYDGASALSRLELAAAEAPEWSEPWSAIAELWLDSPQEQRVERARSAIEKALTRDSADARAWRVLARLRLWEEWDWIGARGALEHAIRIDAQNADVWQLLAALETVLGREDQALAAAHRAVELDPVSTVRRADLGWTLYFFGRPELAAAECGRGLEIDPRSATAEQCLLQARLLTSTNRGEVPPKDLVAQIEARLGGDVDSPSCPTPAAAALPRLLRGDESGAIEALLTSARRGSGWDLPFAIADPLLAPLGSDPRMAEIRAALGLG
jgi:DNA-binding winged helix-turn-helix (wHTH) protein/Flp pilus assembly protein TadD